MLQIGRITAGETAAQRDEVDAVGAVVIRGVAEAPTNFSAIRGKRIGAHTYAVAAKSSKFLSCSIEDNSDGRLTAWRLVCRSIGHKLSVEALAAWLQRAVASAHADADGF